MAGKNNRKFGRNKNRSPAAKRYKNENRCLTNKERKLKKHLKDNPNDKKKIGVVVKFPAVKKVEQESVKTPGPVKVNYARNSTVYFVYAQGHCVECSPRFDDVQSAFRSLNTDAVMYKRVGNLLTIIKTKRATPFVKNSYKLREFLAK